MNALDRLHCAAQAAMAGRYEEALQEYIWFHHHALEENPALRGVRRSFALAYWLQLGEEYPPARQSLMSIRDQKAQQLLDGLEDRELFNDVASINRHAEEESATYRLFVSLRQASPELARNCAGIAMPAILKSGDYELARSYAPDPAASIDRIATKLNNDMQRAKEIPDVERRAARRDAHVRIYAKDVRMLLDIFRETGSCGLAETLRRRALDLVADDAARQKADELLGV
jgi:hypothetical protein